MASRRKYRTPQGFRDGGAVRPEASADAPPPPGPELPPPDPESHDAVRRVAEAARHAEELQRQAAQQPMTVEAYVDAMPGLSDHKRAFLKAHPMLLNEQILPLAARAYQAAVRDHVPDDTEEMNQRLLIGVRQEIEAQRQRQIEAASAAVASMEPTPLPESDDRAAERLDQEANAIHSMMQAADATPTEIVANMPPVSPMPPQRGRSLPISAPVSRDVPTASGQRTSNIGTVVLSAEERDVARRSYHWLSPDLAEREYAFQKAKLTRLRAAGEYPERDRN
jgi:hypothetical protein